MLATLVFLVACCHRAVMLSGAFSLPQQQDHAQLRSICGNSLLGNPCVVGGVRAGKTAAAAGDPDSAGEGSVAVASQLSSVPQSAVNLAKNIAGAGMLSLPAGVAAFSGSPKALVPALAITALLGLLSAYTFVLIADVCQRTGETTYPGVWAKTVSRGTAWLPAVACLSKAAIGCIAFSMILGDCLPLLLGPLGLPAMVTSRTGSMISFTALALLPLCSMKSLAPLAKFAALGVLANVYICLFILKRAFDGSYDRFGSLASAAPVAPKFLAHAGSAWSTVVDPGFSVLLSILATAFLAHYNAPLFYEQLAPGADGKKDTRFAIMSMLGFGGAAVIFATVMAGGFLTFGQSCLGLILNNYAASDGFAAFARVAIAVSLTTGYPIVFFSLRRQLLDLVGKQGASWAEARPNTVTIGLLSGITALALSLTDLGKLVAFAGACFGSFLIYIAPALMVLRAQFRGIGPYPRGFSGTLNRAVQMALIPGGTVLGIVGILRVLS